jgi:hypothetical protein
VTAEEAARAIADAAVAWSRQRISGLDLLDAIARHRIALDDPDPGLHMAWPDAPGDPVPGVDYLIPAAVAA